MNNSQSQQKVNPIVMNYSQLEKTLLPYCYGKRILIQAIKDIWASATPMPNSSSIRIIMPKHFYDFINIAVQENG